MRPAAVMGAVYRATLRELLRDEWRDPVRQVALSRTLEALACFAQRPPMNAGSTNGLTHVVGAGLAGLAAAVVLAGAGRRVRLYEASGHAGGRCRSYFDAELGCRIDNGNHLLLTGNRSTLDYLERIGARGTLDGPEDAVFPFFDATTGRRWQLRPNRGRLPWWILQRSRRVPQTHTPPITSRRYCCAAPIRGQRSSDVLDPQPAAFRPAVGAACRRCAEHRRRRRIGAALLADPLPRRSGAALRHAGRWCRAMAFPRPLSIRRSRPCGGTAPSFHFGARLRAFDFAADRVSILRFDSGPVELPAEDAVILATPARSPPALCPVSRCPTSIRRSSTRISAVQHLPDRRCSSA